MSTTEEKRKPRSWLPGLRYVGQRLFLFAVFAAVLLAAAGRLAWVRAWVYLIYTLLLELATLFLLAWRAPETLAQRGTRHRGVKTFERVFVAGWLTLALVFPAVAGLDERFRWSAMPTAGLYVGAGIMAVASVFGAWAMIVNEHFEQFVRIQTDRGHRVVSSGPYRFIRHPGYAAAIFGELGTPLMLGSWWTFAPAAALALLFILRTAREDQTLLKELEGYPAYASSTRYRLLPGVW